MTAAILFEFSQGFLIGLPLAAAFGWSAWRLRRVSTRTRLLILSGLRAVALVALLFLAARPIWLTKEPPAAATRSVALLMDRSESMSLQDRQTTRYEQALEFVRERL